MSSAEPCLIYVILGAAGSGRRTLLADLISEGLGESERPVVLTSEAETKSDPAEEKKFGRVVHWTLQEGVLLIAPDALGDATHAFFLTDGRTNPVDQLEAFKVWHEGRGLELARVITVVNCRLAEKHTEVAAWYEACIHFSDVVLLSNREGVENKWLSDFQNRFKDQFYPCLFELIKAGRVKNPPMILEPQARRMSHLFDEPDWEIIEIEGAEEVVSDDGRETTQEIEVKEEIDPYIERLAGGHRAKEIPDIAKFLPSE